MYSHYYYYSVVLHQDPTLCCVCRAAVGHREQQTTREEEQIRWVTLCPAVQRHSQKHSLYFLQRRFGALIPSTNHRAESRTTPASPCVHPPPPWNNHRELINSVWERLVLWHRLQSGPPPKITTTSGWIVMKLHSDNFVPRRMKPQDFCASLTSLHSSQQWNIFSALFYSWGGKTSLGIKGHLCIRQHTQLYRFYKIKH